MEDSEASTDGYVEVAPKPIVQLEQDVINKIAAAEIIHRPSNAIKELLENSLDAGSTSIKISIKDGGLKSIQIADNGHGINKADLPLLCTRYATSKLREYKDLESIATYGFRGEALASISYCSLVEVVTKTKSDSCGWKAHYADGVLQAVPKPAAANDGTIITAEDLFFNMPLRKKAFRSPSDEYNRILDVVTKYAIHNPHAAWACKKAGSLPDLSTSIGSTRANIALLYTPALANELLEMPVTDLTHGTCRGWISTANARKSGWLLFINNRLVESSKIRKAIESMYTTFLPKGATPWVYLAISLDPAQVDVNVHPTKSEVHFLHQDELIEGVVAAIHGVLLNANTSRSFTVQSTLPFAEPRETSTSKEGVTPVNKKPAPNYKVRNDLSTQTLDAMITPAASGGGASVTVEAGGDETMGRAAKRQKMDDKVQESLCEFTSVQDLRRACLKRAHNDTIELFEKHAFVGIVDPAKCLGLVQHSTKLHLVNYASLADEHFYQLALRQFGAMDRLHLDPAPDLRELLELGLEDEPLDAENLVASTVADTLETLLLDKREMIDEYFSIGISAEGKVTSLPMILRGYIPNLDLLPHFLLCLGTMVDWTSEKECFQAIIKQLAYFYSPRQAPTTNDARWMWQLEHVLFPSFRRYTAWPLCGHVTQVANLPDLFRIFERC